MTTNASILPGHILGSIAVLGRTTLLESTITTAALLSAIAGPHAAVEGPGGELIHPGLNLISAGRDIASSRRLREVLVEPIIACQRQFREIAHSLSPSRLDEEEFGRFSDETKELIKRSRDGLSGSIPASPSANKQEVAILRRPTFLLQSPDLITLRKSIPETMDGSPLIVTDTLFEELLSCDKESKAFIAGIAGLIAGHDRPAEGIDKRVGPGRMETLKAYLFASTTKEILREGWVSRNSSIQQILRQCLILDAGVFPSGKAKMALADVRSGYRWYYECVKRILDARRGGGGLQWRLSPVACEQLHEFTGELQEWVSAVPEEVKPFFTDILSLPYRLYWTCATTQVGHDHDWVLPFTIQTTRKLIEHQKLILSELIEGTEAQEHQRARFTMLRKLRERPCMFRDLLRRYSVQRRDIHEPVLNELVSEGLIQLRNDGLLELSESGRKELAA